MFCKSIILFKTNFELLKKEVEEALMDVQLLNDHYSRVHIHFPL